MDCQRFRSLTQAYLDDELPAEARASWREHLGGCAQCRDEACALEPTLAFAGLAATEDPLRVERCAVVVQSIIRQQRMLRRMPRRAPRWLAAAAAVALAVAGGLLWQGAPEPTVGVEPLAIAATAPSMPPPQTEVQMDGEDIRVYQFATDGADDLAVTFVVNPALNL